MRQLVSQNLVDLLLDAVCAVRPGGEFVFVSAAFERIFGYTPDEIVGRNMVELVHPDDRAATLQAAQRVMDGHLQLDFENRYLRKDGRTVHIRWTARWVESAGVRVAVAHDVTELKRAQALQSALFAISEAAHTAEDLPTLFQAIHRIIGALVPSDNFSVLLYDPAQDELSHAYHVNTHYAAPAPHPLDEAPRCADLIRGGQPRLYLPALGHTLPQDERHCWLGSPLLTQDGPVGALVLQSYGAAAPYSPADQELLQFISSQVAAAIERKRMHMQLQRLADCDQLTQLPNRRCFMERLRAALALARAHGASLSLLFLDLDGFKRVNDTLGHSVGDLLLQGVGQRLQGCVRATDTVARLGGDEFVVLLEHAPGGGQTQAQAVREKIAAAFREPFDLQGHAVTARPSIGIAHYPEHGQDMQQLIRHADNAMYAAKRERAQAGRHGGG